MSHYCKIARMKPEKAALWLALDDFYRQALASRLPNPTEAKDEPTVAVPAAPVEAGAPAPFVDAKAA
jgi:hypothetical protein